MNRTFRLEEGWLTVGLLALLLFSVTLSIQQAQWSDGLSILTPITIVGLVTGIVLAKVRGVPRFLLDLVGLGVGVVTVLVAVSSVMQDPRLVTIQDRVQDLLVRTAGWINVAIRQDMSDDLAVFILSLAVVCWVLAYSSAYFVFRSRQLWWALVPNGVALLINLSYSVVNLNGYIIVFMFSALLLMIRFNLLLKEERWQRERVNYSPTLTWAFLWAGSLASVVLALTMWYVPRTAVNSTLNGIWEQVNQPWEDFQTRMSELWSPVNGNQAIGGYSSFNKAFTMGGSLNLSDAVAMVVKSREKHYWRATTYDQYTGRGWRNTAADTFHVPGLSPRLALEANQKLGSQDLQRREITYTVQVVAPKGDVIWASLRPVQLTVPTRLDLSWQPLNEVFYIDILDAASPEERERIVPLELRALIGRLREAQRELREKGPSQQSVEPLEMLYATEAGPQIRAQIDELSKRGLTVAPELDIAANYAVSLRAAGEVPVYDDIMSLHAVGPLSRNQQYEVVSSVSEAEAADLRAAESTYPAWVLQRYLEVPATVSQRVKELALQVTAEAQAVNAYDRAKAIETHLRENYIYSTSIGQPPSGVDRVDWFLFEGKQGYCEYYATSMVVMLRSVGIPSRLATGYAPGTYDAQRQAYIVRESAAHAWPEVYFPGYGWIEFEPTPSQAVLSRQREFLTEPDIPTPAAPVDASPIVRDDGRNPEDFASGGAGFTGPGGVDMPGGFFGWVLFAGGILGLFALWYRNSELRRRLSAPLSAVGYYGKMILWSRVLNLGPSPHQTPYEFSEALAREVPGTAPLTRSIARAYVREQFGRRGSSLRDRHELSRAWLTLRSKLLRSAPARHLRGATRRTRVR